MKTILVFVSTLNGKITKDEDPEVRSWSSKEDQEYYSGIWKQSGLVIMGSTTYDLNKITPLEGRLIIVMTRKPQLYDDITVNGQLEFSSDLPGELVAKYQDKYHLMTVVGGPHLATSFLKEELIDELWLTIEPKLFGRGADLIVPEDLYVDLRMISCERVNDNGTLITKYEVIKTKVESQKMIKGKDNG